MSYFTKSIIFIPVHKKYLTPCSPISMIEICQWKINAVQCNAYISSTTIYNDNVDIVIITKKKKKYQKI